MIEKKTCCINTVIETKNIALNFSEIFSSKGRLVFDVIYVLRCNEYLTYN